MTDPKLERALALHRDGKVAKAIPLYRAALKSQPRNFEVLYRLGLAMAQQGKFSEAARWVGKALDVDSGVAQAQFDLGCLMLRLRRLDAAVAALEKAVVLAPDHAGAHHNLGVALSDLGRADAALRAFDRTIELQPSLDTAYYNRANTLKKLHQYDRAIGDYRQVLSIAPDHVAALNNLGNCLYTLGRYGEAYDALRRAVEIRPDYAHAWFNLTDLLRRRGHWEEALQAVERVAAIDPDYPGGLGAVVGTMAACCDWDAVERHMPQLVRGVRANKLVTEPFTLLGVSDSPADQLTCAKTWVRYKCPPVRSGVWRGERYGHDKIRLAYVSADFHHHPMAFLMSGLFEHHDRSRFELTAIAFDADEDTPIRRRMKDSFDHFIEARQMSDVAVAGKIRDLEIDIAIDRKGHTRDARTQIFALRPAPLQVNYLAYPGTMGAPYIDYIFADRFVIPAGEERHYSEKVVRLPDTYQANDSRRPVADFIPSRADVGLPEQGFVFCCFNNSYKITRPVFEVWMELLRTVEGSVLWLYGHNPVAERNLRAAARARGVDDTRLVFGKALPNDEHLARLGLADLSLDTLPYGAHTTASDSLYAGVPVITCPGTTFAGGVTAGLLHAIGLPELVTPSLQAYRDMALSLARDPAALARLRSRLAENRETRPLFDTALFCRNIEAAFERIWTRHETGLPPEAFDLPPGDGTA